MANQQKRNRKFDRNRKRSPSMANYRASNRATRNKERAIKKDKKAKEKAALKNAEGGKLHPKSGTPHGTKRDNLREFYRTNPSKRPVPEEAEPAPKYNPNGPVLYAHFYGKKGTCVLCRKERKDVVNGICLSCEEKK